MAPAPTATSVPAQHNHGPDVSQTTCLRHPHPPPGRIGWHLRPMRVPAQCYAIIHQTSTKPLTCATTRPHRMAHMSLIWACTRLLLLRQLSTSTLSAARCMAKSRAEHGERSSYTEERQKLSSCTGCVRPKAAIQRNLEGGPPTCVTCGPTVPPPAGGRQHSPACLCNTQHKQCTHLCIQTPTAPPPAGAAGAAPPC